MKLPRSRLPAHATVVAYLALFVALGGTTYAAATIGSADIQANAILSRHIHAGSVGNTDIAANAVTGAKIAANAVTGAKVLNGSLTWADLGATLTTVQVSHNGLNAGTCANLDIAVSGLHQDEGVLAYSNSDWDNRLVIAGVEASEGDLGMHICNWTTNTNLGASPAGSITLIRF